MGCGRVGSALAHTLDEAGHSVAVIDQDSTSFRKLHTDFGGTTVTGIGFDRDHLSAAGILLDRNLFRPLAEVMRNAPGDIGLGDHEALPPGDY